MGMDASKTFRVQIYTRAFEKLCAFYGGVLQLPVLEQRETSYDDRVIVYGAASGQIEVIYAPDGMEYPSSNGWTLQIEGEDADASCERVKELGYEVLRGPQDQFWGHRNFKVQDPSGLELTFFSPLKTQR